MDKKAKQAKIMNTFIDSSRNELRPVNQEKFDRSLMRLQYKLHDVKNVLAYLDSKPGLSRTLSELHPFLQHEFGGRYEIDYVYVLGFAGTSKPEDGGIRVMMFVPAPMSDTEWTTRLNKALKTFLEDGKKSLDGAFPVTM